MAGNLAPGLTPAGWLSEVELSLSTKGEMFSKLSLPDRIPQFDIWQFLGSNERAVILKLATPEDSR